MGIAAETVYLFRLPVLRDAAYQLQVPSDRARLHRMALEIMETMFDGPPPEPARDSWGDLSYEPHPIDPVSADLAEHAHGIRQWEADKDGSLLARETLYLRRAAEYAEARFDNEDALRLWQRHATVAMEEQPEDGPETTAEKQARLDPLDKRRAGGFITGRAMAAESIRRAGVVLSNSGRAFEAEPLFVRAGTMAAGASNRRTEGAARSGLAGMYYMTGRPDEAERSYEQALEIHREAGNRHFEAVALGNLANLYWGTGRMDRAERTHRQALTIHREVGSRRGEGIALGGLASVYRETGRLEKAERTHNEALAIHRQVGNRQFEAVVLANLATVYQKTERMAQAAQTHEQALTIHRQVGNRRGVAIVLGNLANLYAETGRAEEAELSYLQALTMHREVGNRRGGGIALGNLAGLYLKSERLEDAERSYRQALATHRQTKNRRFEGLHTCGYGLCLLALKRTDSTLSAGSGQASSRQADAREVWQRGAKILKGVGDKTLSEQQASAMREACAKAGVEPFDR